jgi:hypothetical protein
MKTDGPQQRLRGSRAPSSTVAYVFGAGASAHAGYPLASNLLPALSSWLDGQDLQDPSIGKFRHRLLQLRSFSPSLKDFEAILSSLSSYGQGAKIESDAAQLLEDFHEDYVRDSGNSPRGFYPQQLRSDLVSAIREFFYHLESTRSESSAYTDFADRHVFEGDTLITFNYDLALERALRKADKWDIGTGYGFPFFPGKKPQSPTTVFKLHGSVNWFKTPMQQSPPPLMGSRDIELLGYQDLKDPRIGANGFGASNAGALILPDTDKQFYWEQLWLPLWESAAQQLRGVREVFIHGYSLPSADAHARRLLFENVSRRASVHVFCRNDSEVIAAEFRKVGFSDVRPNPEVEFEAWSFGKSG